MAVRICGRGRREDAGCEQGEQGSEQAHPQRRTHGRLQRPARHGHTASANVVAEASPTQGGVPHDSRLRRRSLRFGSGMAPMSGKALSVRKALSEPSPSDWERWEAVLARGVEPKLAAEIVGKTCTAFRKDDEVRQRALLAMSRAARGYVVDNIVEGDVCVRDADGVPIGFKEDVSDSMKQFYARRWQPAYATQAAQVEISGPDGGPIEVAEGFAPTTLADMVKLAGELGVLGQLGYERAEVVDGEAVEVSDERDAERDDAAVAGRASR